MQEPSNEGRVHAQNMQQLGATLHEIEDYCYQQGIYDTALRLRYLFHHAPSSAKEFAVQTLNDFLNGHLQSNPENAQRLVDNACDPESEWMRRPQQLDRKRA